MFSGHIGDLIKGDASHGLSETDTQQDGDLPSRQSGMNLLLQTCDKRKATTTEGFDDDFLQLTWDGVTSKLTDT